eukprot:scaffold16488_cov24-Tisochrysis_lutea.AAC.3
MLSSDLPRSPSDLHCTPANIALNIIILLAVMQAVPDKTAWFAAPVRSAAASVMRAAACIRMVCKKKACWKEVSGRRESKNEFLIALVEECREEHENKSNGDKETGQVQQSQVSHTTSVQQARLNSPHFVAAEVVHAVIEFPKGAYLHVLNGLHGMHIFQARVGEGCRGSV